MDRDRSKYVAPPISRQELRQMAYEVRRRSGLANEYAFPIVEFLELVFCPKFGYTLSICNDEEMPINHGETNPIQKLIRLRESVYLGAADNKPRDRMTVAHEIGHAMLLQGSVTLARVAPDTKVPLYRDAEWQAAAFAGELMIPKHLVLNNSVMEIAGKCNVSFDAACFQWNIFKKEKSKV